MNKNDDPLQRLKHRVFKPIEEKIYLPLNRLVDRLGYIPSVLLLVAITAISTLAIKLWNNPDEASRAITTMRFYVDARRPTPPRNPAVREVIRDLTNQLKDTMSPSNRNRVGVAGDWAEAQMAVSLRREDAFDPAELVEWFHTEWQTCQCWRAGPHDPPHLGATGWVLLAFASMRAKPTEQELEFVLGNQHRPGWWPIYPALDLSRNASTYATALCTWALEELLERDLIPVTQRQRATEAVRKGRNWLLDNSVPENMSLWKDYPTAEYGRESSSVSGLVLHVLHRTPGASPSANDSAWMANLPSKLPAPNDGFSSGQEVIVSEQTAIPDPTHQFLLPWLIIGTADAYHQGSLAQRAQASRLFYEIPKKRQVISTQLRDMPWLAAETVIALRQLEGEDIL